MTALKVVLAAASLSILAAFAADEAVAKEIRIGTISAAGSPWDKALQRFAEVLAAETDGELRASVYTDGQLGDIPQLLTGMQLGNVEMGYFGLGSATYLKEAAPLTVIYAPYLFRDAGHAERALNSPAFHEIYDDIAEATGVRIVAAWGQRSPRAVQSVKGPVEKPEDLNGMKLRIPAMPIFEETFKTLGVQIVPMGMTEIYTGLSKGLVEGQDNGFDLALPLKFHEVAKHWSATGHAYETTGWFISEQLWQSLSDDERTAISKATEEGGKVTTAEEVKLQEEALKVFEAEGVIYTVPDREAFREALKDVAAKFEGSVWPEGFTDQIQAIE
nr:TRAP transporter substrate-binding protein [Tianweitania sediminis]